MGNELIKVTPSLSVDMNYSSNLPQNVVTNAGIIVMGSVAALVVEGIRATTAVVEAWGNAQTKITFYRERERLREIIMPTVALYQVAQEARDIANNMGLDEDLRLMALQDIDKKIQQYRAKQTRMSLVPSGGNKDIIDYAFEIADALLNYANYIYYWLRDFAPIIIKYKLKQMGRDGVDNLPFLSWETKQEIKRWLKDFL